MSYSNGFTNSFIHGNFKAYPNAYSLFRNGLKLQKKKKE